MILNVIPLSGQYTSVTIQTPRGVSIDALRFNGTDFSAPDIAYWNNYWTNGYNCRIIGNATNYYNCHGYAWYDIEGHMSQADLLWINDVDGSGNPLGNVTKYYSGANPSYIETSTVTNHLKVSYYPRDHSAVTTESDSLISKFAYGPLVKHTVSQCPFYTGAQIKYYRLNPAISGSTALLCNGQQRTFTSNTSIPGSTYNWVMSQLSYVSGTTSCIVSGNGAGDAYIYLQMTTPSGEVATTSSINFWVGTAQVQSISGPSSTTRNAYNYYYANANHTSGTSYNWSVSPSGPYVSPSGGEVNSCLIVFYNTGSYQVLARAVNACGTTTWCPKSVYVGGGKMLTLFPNPASDNVSITVNEDPQIFVANDSLISSSVISNSSNVEPKTYTIRIFNSQSALLSTSIRSGKNFNVPLTNMREGTYIIEVSEGNNRYTQQLIVKHN